MCVLMLQPVERSLYLGPLLYLEAFQIVGSAMGLYLEPPPFLSSTDDRFSSHLQQRIEFDAITGDWLSQVDI